MAPFCVILYFWSVFQLCQFRIVEIVIVIGLLCQHLCVHSVCSVVYKSSSLLTLLSKCTRWMRCPQPQCCGKHSMMRFSQQFSVVYYLRFIIVKLKLVPRSRMPSCCSQITATDKLVMERSASKSRWCGEVTKFLQQKLILMLH